jgi:hypothetical protein
MVDQYLQDGPHEHHDVEHKEEDEFRSEHGSSIALFRDLTRRCGSRGAAVGEVGGVKTAAACHIWGAAFQLCQARLRNIDA